MTRTATRWIGPLAAAGALALLSGCYYPPPAAVSYYQTPCPTPATSAAPQSQGGQTGANAPTPQQTATQQGAPGGTSCYAAAPVYAAPGYTYGYAYPAYYPYYYPGYYYPPVWGGVTVGGVFRIR